MGINLEKVIQKVASYLRVKLFIEWTLYQINRVVQIQLKSSRVTLAKRGVVIRKTNR